MSIHWRLSHAATDEASSLIAIQEFLDQHPEIDIIALIQCTSPFLKKYFLLEALEKIQKQEVDCVFSVTR